MKTLIPIFAALAGILLAAFTLYLLYRDVRKSPGGRVLFYDPSLWLAGIVGMFTFLTASYFSWNEGGITRPLVLGVFSVLVLMCLALILEAGFVRIIYDDFNVTTRSPWRPSRRIPWHSFTGYAWSGINRWHILETRNHGKIRLSAYLVGLPEFFTVLVEKTGVYWVVQAGIKTTPDKPDGAESEFKSSS